jgi:hypothetical protein
LEQIQSLKIPKGWLWEKKMETFISKILPAILGFLAGIAGSLFAPWVNWGIEKKREKLKYKRELIKCWREYVDRHFDWNTFRDTSMFSEMKPFLSETILNELDPPDFEKGTPIINVRSPIGRDTLKSRLLDEITRIETKWKLL